MRRLFSTWKHVSNSSGRIDKVLSSPPVTSFARFTFTSNRRLPSLRGHCSQMSGDAFVVFLVKPHNFSESFPLIWGIMRRERHSIKPPLLLHRRQEIIS